MVMMPPSFDADELLANTAWVRRLAAHLVRGPDADDLAQEVWVAAAGSPRPAGVAAATWLGGIVRNLAKMRARSEGRRVARENRASLDAALAPCVPGPEGALERLELQQRLGTLVLDLAEPYRTAIVLRYYEGLGASEIARQHDIPAGTVRWRLKEGLDRLRAQLDEQWGGRAAWIPVLGALPEIATVSSTGFVPVATGLGLILLGGMAVVVGRGAIPLSSNPLVRPETTALAETSSVGPRPDVVRSPARAAQAPRFAGPNSISTLTGTGAFAGEPSSPGGRPLLAADNRANRELLAASGGPADTAFDAETRFRRVQVPLGGAPIAGPADAKLTIVLFGEYECPFSAHAYARLERFRAARPRDIRLQLVQAPLPIHTHAVAAARAVYAAAEQDKYWEMHRLLFADSPEQVGRDSHGKVGRPGLEPAELLAYARKAGLDIARFKADLDGPAVDNKLAIDKATVDSAGPIPAIPVLFINGRRLNGARSEEIVTGVLAEELRAAERVLARGVAPKDLYNILISQGGPKLVHLDAAQLDRLVGTYRVEKGPRWAIARQGAHLTFTTKLGPIYELAPISEAAFVVTNDPLPGALSRPAHIVIPRYASGQARSIEITATDGIVTRAARIQAGSAVRSPVPFPHAASTSNETFESGTLAAWRTEVSGSGNWYVYSDGKVAPEPSQTDPGAPFDVPDPPQGRFAVVADMKAPGTRILYRDLSLDGRYRMHMRVYYAGIGPLATPVPNTLEHEQKQPNQQYRIDLISVSAPIDSIDPSHVLAAVFETSEGAPSRLDPTAITFDLSQWQGQIVRLRLAVTDNRGPLRAGMDDLRFEKF